MGKNGDLQDVTVAIELIPRVFLGKGLFRLNKLAHNHQKWNLVFFAPIGALPTVSVEMYLLLDRFYFDHGNRYLIGSSKALQQSIRRSFARSCSPPIARSFTLSSSLPFNLPVT